MASRIRVFTAADHAQAKALWLRTEGVGLSAADEAGPIAAFLARNPGLSFVAESVDRDGTAGRIIGTILVGHDGRRGLIHHLAVDPACRRRGLGRDLLAAAMTALAGTGIGKGHLFVFRENAAGQAFWAALGATRREELLLYSLDLG